MRVLFSAMIALMLAIAVHLVWFVIQGVFFVVDPPMPHESELGLMARLLLTLYWAVLGYGLSRALDRYAAWPALTFVAAPAALSALFVMLHLFVGKNELAGAISTLWFMPLGYFLGGLAYHVSSRGNRNVAA